MPAGQYWALAINDMGQIVGYRSPAGWPFAWAFPPINGSDDLNDLIPNHPDWKLEAATGINARGHIVGTARVALEARAFLLAPEGEIRVLHPFDRALEDRILFGITSDGGGRYLRRGPVPPLGPRELRERLRER
jgi:hypothetical protein